MGSRKPRDRHRQLVDARLAGESHEASGTEDLRGRVPASTLADAGHPGENSGHGGVFASGGGHNVRVLPGAAKPVDGVRDTKAAVRSVPKPSKSWGFADGWSCYIRRHAAAKQGGNDFSNAIARPNECGRQARSCGDEKQMFCVRANASKKADCEAANILRKIAVRKQDGEGTWGWERPASAVTGQSAFATNPNPEPVPVRMTLPALGAKARLIYARRVRRTVQAPQSRIRKGSPTRWSFCF